MIGCVYWRVRLCVCLSIYLMMIIPNAYIWFQIRLIIFENSPIDYKLSRWKENVEASRLDIIFYIQLVIIVGDATIFVVISVQMNTLLQRTEWKLNYFSI